MMNETERQDLIRKVALILPCSVFATKKMRREEAEFVIDFIHSMGYVIKKDQ